MTPKQLVLLEFCILDWCVIRPIPVHFPGAIQSPNEA